MAVAKLNVDILSIVCDFLTDVSHILSFALTCSTLHSIAIRRLLSMGPVYLAGSSSIRRFHSFMFADKVARARHVRALAIGTRLRPRELPEATPAPSDRFLIDILNLCPNLERISVVLRATPPRPTKKPCISDVIAAIPSLRSLSIRGKPADNSPFFRQIRAPLRMLGLHYITPEDGTWSPAALEKILPRFAATLEELELNSFYSGPRDRQAQGNISTSSQSVFRTTQYPAVRSFSVNSYVGMPSLGHLQHLFPALDGTLALSLFGVWTQEHLFAGVRAANQRAQDPDGKRKRAWSKLARVICGVPMFYVLGLRCPIGLVMLDRASKYNKRHLVPALRENPVPRLKLSLMLNRGLEVLDDGLFPPELGDTLTHLTLFCADDRYGRVGNDEEAVASVRRHWDDVLDKMRSSLEPLHRLTHLRIVFHYIVHDSSIPREEEGPCLRALRGPAFELGGSEETAASLARLLPSLRYVFLTAAGVLAPDRESRVPGRWHAARAWRVEAPSGTEVDNGGRPVLVALHDEVAETIIRKEELVLSQADKAVLHKYDDL